jgi:hypothetical protein
MNRKNNINGNLKKITWEIRQKETLSSNPTLIKDEKTISYK